MKAACPECSSTELHLSPEPITPLSFAAAQDLLYFAAVHARKWPEQRLVVCANCGLTRAYATQAGRRLVQKHWPRIDGTLEEAMLRPSQDPEAW